MFTAGEVFFGGEKAWSKCVDPGYVLGEPGKFEVNKGPFIYTSFCSVHIIIAVNEPLKIVKCACTYQDPRGIDLRDVDEIVIPRPQDLRQC